MSTRVAAPRDDRVLPYARVLRLFAWTIKPTMTPMVLDSAYLGGASFFLPVLRERRWNVVKTGFLSVALFASLLGVARIVHWNEFNLAHIAIWPWTLTPLTCRVVGAIFCLGSTGTGVLVDPRWSTVRLTLQAEALMVSLNVCRHVSEDVPGVGRKVGRMPARVRRRPRCGGRKVGRMPARVRRRPRCGAKRAGE